MPRLTRRWCGRARWRRSAFVFDPDDHRRRHEPVILLGRAVTGFVAASAAELGDVVARVVRGRARCVRPPGPRRPLTRRSLLGWPEDRSRPLIAYSSTR